MVLLSLGSCSADEVMTQGEGQLALHATFDGTVKAESRVSAEEESYLRESLVMWIYKHTDNAATSGVIRRYKGLNTIPLSLALSTGTYSVEAWAGDSVSASWEKRWYHGLTDRVAITKDVTTQVDVVCKIANVAVEVKYDPAVLNAMQVDSLVVSHSRGVLAFKGDKPEHTVGYFMMPNGETTLTWTLVGNRRIGDQVEPTVETHTSTILNVEKGHKYTFNIMLADETSSPIGGGFLDIKVIDEPMVTEEKEVTVKLAPIVSREDGASIDEPIRFAPGQVGDQVFKIEASGELKDVVLKSQLFTQIGLSGAEVDLMQAQSSVLDQLNDKVIYDYKYTENPSNADKNASSMYVKFLKAFTDLFEEGTHTITFRATDSYGKTTEKTATFVITNSPIEVSPMNPSEAAPDELTVNKMVVKGQIVDMSKLPANPQITMYYTEGVQSSRAEWQSVPATISGNTYSATLTGLTPGTTYSYYAAIVKADGTTAYTDIAQGTTEEALQLPNSSFEITKGTSPILFYDNNDDMFWDSGNHGSSTLRKNVTVTTSEMKHNGNQALSLESQKVTLFGMGKFAAGNIFAGAYLKTDGTDGELGWGRPFTGRPTKLKVWAHYTPVAIDEKASDAPSEYVKGEMDRGIIYVALMDANTTEYSVESDNKNEGIAGKKVNFPVIIKTKTENRQLFEPDGKDASHVIAYGEHIFEGATPGNSLVEITIDIDYSRGNKSYTKDNIRPSYIVLTASASKGGDYFTGGSGSKLVLDDIELIYE